MSSTSVEDQDSNESTAIVTDNSEGGEGEESSDQVARAVRASKRMRRRPRHLSPDQQQKRYQEVEYESQDMDDE